MEHKYQWSVFVDQSKQQQFCVRCDDFVDFLEAMEQIQSLLPEPTNEPEAVEPEVPKDVCPIHNRPMKRRTSKNGRSWYDHHWEKDGVWHTCNGKSETTQE